MKTHKFKVNVLTSPRLGIIASAIVPSPSATGYALVFSAPGGNKSEAVETLRGILTAFVKEGGLSNIEETEIEVPLSEEGTKPS